MTYNDWICPTCGPRGYWESVWVCGVCGREGGDGPPEPECNCYVAGLPPSAAARNPPHALYCPERAR